MKKSRVVGLFVVMAAVLALLVFLLQPLVLEDATVSIKTASESRHVLETLGLPGTVAEDSGITVIGADGPMPEIATRSFHIESSFDSIIEFYRARCDALGLATPGADLAAIEPAAICEGPWNGSSVTVLVYPECESSMCRVTLEVRVLWM